MAAAAHLHYSIISNSAGSARNVPTAAPPLSRSRLPPAQKQLFRAGDDQRHGLVSSELDEPSGELSRWSRGRRRLLQAGVFGEREQRRAAIRPHASRGDHGAPTRRAPRFLCLHGFRTSGEIMRRQVERKWPAEVTSRMDFAFADAPFPAEGESPVAGVFDPPYYEWCPFVGEDFLKYRNFGKCLANVEELMVREGSFDGLFGFSQASCRVLSSITLRCIARGAQAAVSRRTAYEAKGGLLSAALAGLQEQGLALNRVPKVKYLIVISGAKIQYPEMAAKAYANKIKCPSLHFIGDKDFVKTHGEELADSFEDPLVIRHPGEHKVPKLDEKGLQVMLNYLDTIERDLSRHSIN